jgi:hypothetical protein
MNLHILNVHQDIFIPSRAIEFPKTIEFTTDAKGDTPFGEPIELKLPKKQMKTL